MGVLELPELYNVGADLLERNLDAGRSGKRAIASASKDVTYGELFELANGAARALRDLGARSASSSSPTTAPAGLPPSLGRSGWARYPCP
jgi:hypothetical protein